MKDNNKLYNSIRNFLIIYFIITQIMWLFWFFVGLFRKETAKRNWIVLGIAGLIYYFFMKEYLHLT
jgi:predicted permease